MDGVVSALSAAESADPGLSALETLLETLRHATDPARAAVAMLQSPDRPSSCVDGAKMLGALEAVVQAEASCGEVSVVPVLVEMLGVSRSPVERQSAGWALRTVGLRQGSMVVLAMTECGLEDHWSNALALRGECGADEMVEVGTAVAAAGARAPSRRLRDPISKSSMPV